MWGRVKVKLYRYWIERAYKKKRWNLFIAPFIFLFSILYLIAGKVRYTFGSLFAYFPRRVKVISVGSPFSGGSGKTLFAIFLTSYLRNKGLNVLYLFKPYKRGKKIFNMDEYEEVKSVLREKVVMPFSLKKELKKIDEEGDANIVVIDDALTHPFVGKHVDVITLNEEVMGVRGVLPYGPLRIPFKEANGLTVIKTIDAGKEGVSMKVIPHSLFDAKRERTVPLSNLKTGEWVAFAGTGDPFSFFALINRLVSVCKKQLIFPDHHMYSRRDIKEIVSWDGLYITTMKDLFRLREHLSIFPNLFVLKVKTEVCGIELMERFLASKGIM